MSVSNFAQNYTQCTYNFSVFYPQKRQIIRTVYAVVHSDCLGRPINYTSNRYNLNHILEHWLISINLPPSVREMSARYSLLLDVTSRLFFHSAFTTCWTPSRKCALLLKKLALYNSFTYLLTYLLTYERTNERTKRKSYMI